MIDLSVSVCIPHGTPDRVSRVSPVFSGSFGKVELDRRSEKPPPEDQADAGSPEVDDYDYVPHFQRVSISGEDTSGVRIGYNSVPMYTGVQWGGVVVVRGGGGIEARYV